MRKADICFQLIAKIHHRDPQSNGRYSTNRRDGNFVLKRKNIINKPRVRCPFAMIK